MLGRWGPSPWRDLPFEWKPRTTSSLYRFHLPPPQPLEVTLIKHAGGSRNRIWQIQIGPPENSPVRIEPYLPKPFQEESSPALYTRRSFCYSNEWPDWKSPGLWVRRERDSWQFLAYQDRSGPGPGPIEIVPRETFQPGQEVQWGEGYFTWKPGMQEWVACDAWGRF